MLFFFGKTISESKKNLYSLKKIFGLNKTSLKKIFKNLGINQNSKLKELNKIQIDKLIKYIDKNYIIEQDLKKNIKENLSHLYNIKNYKGIRLLKGLPVNGQRTHTNAKTSKKLKKL